MKQLYQVFITFLSHDSQTHAEIFFVYARRQCDAVNICIKYIQESPDIKYRISKLLRNNCILISNFLK